VTQFANRLLAALIMAGSLIVIAGPAIAGRDDGSGPAAASGKSKKVPPPLGPLQVCADQGCVPAAENYSNAEVVGGLFELLKKNERTAVLTCMSDAESRRCGEGGYDLFVMAGPLPAYANLKTITFKNLRLSPDNMAITMSIGITGTFLGASASCQDFPAELIVDGTGTPILRGTDSFYCNWLVIGNIFWDYEHRFDYIDFTKGVIGGQFDFSAIGLLTAGGATGYGLQNLRQAGVALGSGPAAAPAAALNQPEPAVIAAPAAAVSEPVSGPAQKLATLQGLRDEGLIDDREFSARRKAILDQQFGAESPAPPATQAAAAAGPEAAGIAGIEFGNYHALVIGSNEYQYLPRLKTAVDDATAVAAVLEGEYGFRVKLMLNSGALDIVDAFDEMRETLGPDDNLLIYYAGHGWLDEETGQGYWLAVDAKPNRRSRWVSNSTLKDTLKALTAKHVMVVADSCFSGTLTRGASIGIRGADYLRKMAVKQARVAITSGGLEPVADAGSKSDHSPFAKAFIEALRGNKAVLDGTTLFNTLRRPVMVATDQTPAYSDVRNAGHDGGDFLFVKKR